MSKNLKFRAWDKKLKQMFIIFDSEKQEDWFFPKWKENLEVMQYTGLKDKNEVEIYEGDIVRCDDRKNAEVIYMPCEYALVMKSQECPQCGLLTENWRKKYEVIGNIYENEELLDR